MRLTKELKKVCILSAVLGTLLGILWTAGACLWDQYRFFDQFEGPTKMTAVVGEQAYNKAGGLILDGRELTFQKSLVTYLPDYIPRAIALVFVLLYCRYWVNGARREEEPAQTAIAEGQSEAAVGEGATTEAREKQL